MAGLIQQSMPGAAAPGSAPSTLKVTPQMVESGLHLQPDQAQQLKRIVVAGMKVMFSPQTHNLMLKQLQSGGPILRSSPRCAPECAC